MVRVGTGGKVACSNTQKERKTARHTQRARERETERHRDAQRQKRGEENRLSW